MTESRVKRPGNTYPIARVVLNASLGMVGQRPEEQLLENVEVFSARAEETGRDGVVKAGLERRRLSGGHDE